jgi:osmoprotectant transport system permease protein
MIELLGALAAWFTDATHWAGTSGIPNRVLEHLALSGVAVAVAVAVAVPAGLYIGHTNRGALVTVSVANIGRAVPSLALLIVFVSVLGLGFRNAVVVLVLLAIPPILTNTYAGMRGVDRDVVEAARGMGMPERTIVRRVELPLAMSVIVTGIRTAAVQVVATATLAALVGGGGLGRFIVDGFAVRDEARLLGGAILVALLALATERGMTVLERRLTPRGLRPAAGGSTRSSEQRTAPVTP